MNDASNQAADGTAITDPAAAPEPEQQTETTKSVQPAVEKATESEVVERRKRVIEEAGNALAETKNALAALNKEDSAVALDALATVTGKFEVILAREPGLALAPVEVQTMVHDVFASTGAIKELIEDAEHAIKHGDVQTARDILANLASEVVVQTSSLPLATYPNAIKAVAPLIDAGKLSEARETLQAVLGTLVVTRDVIIPLPVLRVRAMLNAAETLAENTTRSDDENERLSLLLTEAKTQIEMAELLGYGRRKVEYKDLYTQLKDVEKKVSAGKDGKGFFDEISATFRKLFDRQSARDADQ